MKNYEEQMKEMITNLGSPENIEAAIRNYVNSAGNIVSDKQSAVLLSMLGYAVQNNLISAK